MPPHCVSKIYGWPMMSLDNTLLRNMYRLLLSRPELVTQILDYLEIPKDLRGLTVVVTAGPNQEKDSGSRRVYYKFIFR